MTTTATVTKNSMKTSLALVSVLPLPVVPLVLMVFLFEAPVSHGFLAIPSFVRFGSCSDVTVVPGLDLEKFSGLWYTVEKIPNEYDPAVSCINTEYVYHGDHMRTSQRGLDEDNNKMKILTKLTFDEVDDEQLVLTVHADGVPNAPYKIIAIDYTSYACVYTCIGVFGFKGEFGFVLTRDPLPKPGAVQACRDALGQRAGLDVDSFVIVPQGEMCPYWTKLNRTTRQHGSPLLVLQVSGEGQQQLNSSVSSQHVPVSSSSVMTGSTVTLLLTVYSMLLVL